VANLANIKFKLKRAKTHLDALDVEITKFAKTKTYSFSSEDDAERGEYVLTITPNDAEPLPCTVVAGDFICCLRSSLDYLVYQLASLSGKIPGSEISFPVFGEDSLDTQLRITRKTYGVPDAAVIIIKSLQPYNSGNAYKSTHLWRLNKLWNIDKHRHLPLHSVFSHVAFPRVPQNMAPRPEILNDGSTYRLRFPAAAKPYIDLKPRISTDVQFGDEREGVAVLPKDFRDMYEFVRNKVIPRFAGFLK
jgi:hypothetical protein